MNKNILSQLEAWKAWYGQPKNKIFVASAALMLVILVATQLISFSPPETADHLPESADTFIPAGFVLVPLELQNAESLSSLMGSFALVDLFTGLPGSRNQRVGKRLKLLRAPLNPQQFAVLVPEKDVSQLLSSSGPYWAALQNPNEKSPGSISKKQNVRIEYFQGDKE